MFFKKFSLIFCAIMFLNLFTGCGSEDSRTATYKEDGIKIEDFINAYNSYAKKEFQIVPYNGKKVVYDKYDKITESFNTDNLLVTAWLAATVFERLEINFKYRSSHSNGYDSISTPRLETISIMVTDTDGQQPGSYANQYQLMVYSDIVKAIQKLTGLNCDSVMAKINQYNKYAENDDINFYSTTGGNVTVEDINFNMGMICSVNLPEPKSVLKE